MYQSGSRIVAMGIGNGDVHQAMYHGHPDEEFYMFLDDFDILSEPLTAAKIKEITNSSIVFTQTMFSVGSEKGEGIWEYIEENLL